MRGNLGDQDLARPLTTYLLQTGPFQFGLPLFSGSSERPHILLQLVGGPKNMKLNASLGGHDTVVSIRREGSRGTAEVGDRKYELDVHESGQGYLLIWNQQVFDCRVEGSLESGHALDVVVNTNHYAVTLTDRRRLRGASEAGAHGDEAARIIAPMPGKIVRVLVSAGEQVEAGAGIVVVEAMKMQNEMKSPKTGTVTSVNVEIGETVNAGQVLAIIE